MPASTPTLLRVPYREVSHDQPDDCLHYEPVVTRLRQMNWTIPAHCHEGLHQFQFLLAGSMQGSVDGHAFVAERPAMLMLAPGTMHGFSYSHDAVGHQLTVPTVTLRRLLDGSELAQDWLGRSFSLLDLAPAAIAMFDSLFERIATEFNGSQPGRVHALLAAATLLAVDVGRLRDEQFEREQRPGLRDTLQQRFLTLLEQHYLEHWSLAAYAAALGVTADHLSRGCREVAGQGALQLVHGRILLEARRLLAYTPMPVTEVAERLGYADTAYFSKFFRRGVGHSPSEYRQRVGSGIQAAD